MLIEKNAKISDVKKPTPRIRRSYLKSALMISKIKKTIAPSIVGMPSINANLEESFKLSPKNNAAVIAIPDLDAPGIKAKD